MLILQNKSLEKFEGSLFMHFNVSCIIVSSVIKILIVTYVGASKVLLMFTHRACSIWPY